MAVHVQPGFEDEGGRAWAWDCSARTTCCLECRVETRNISTLSHPACHPLSSPDLVRVLCVCVEALVDIPVWLEEILWSPKAGKRPPCSTWLTPSLALPLYAYRPCFCCNWIGTVLNGTWMIAFDHSQKHTAKCNRNCMSVLNHQLANGLKMQKIFVWSETNLTVKSMRPKSLSKEWSGKQWQRKLSFCYTTRSGLVTSLVPRCRWSW